MKCPRCQHENPAGQKFCGECATPLKAVSPGGPRPPSYAEVTSALSEALTLEAEALEQQTATSEILRVISRSQTDVQPVFDTIVQSAVRLCEGVHGTVVRFDGELVHRMASFNVEPEGEEALRRFYPRPAGRELAITRAVLDGATVHVPDVRQDPEYSREVWQATRASAVLAVPMLRDERPIGAIAVVRHEPGPFSDNQIELLQTFADQAVIAIENVRLFKETKEALAQQTATGEILKVISGSPTDAQPVFDTISRSAAALCDAEFCGVFRYDSQLIHLVARNTPNKMDAIAQTFPMPPSRGGVTARAILERQMQHTPDIAEDPEYAYADLVHAGFRSTMSAPMLRDGTPIGAITVARGERREFTKTQVALLQTFADQAVIAIENVRLFTELQANNQALTQAHAQVSEALEQQTATSEILRVISSSPTDVQPVFDAIVRSASQLCDGADCIAVRFDGELMHLMARHNPKPGTLESVAALFPRRPSRDGTATDRAILDGQMVHVADILEDPTHDQRRARAGQLRSVLSVPLMRGGKVIGTISVSRAVPGLFSHRQVELLKIFADQAVIAIENVRLFTELETRNSELRVALEQQTATSEILRVISSSPTDVQPTFDAIAASATQLCGALNSLVIRFDGRLMHLAAHHNVSPERLDALEQVFPMPPSRASVSGRAIMTGAVAHVADIGRDPEYALPVATLVGYRSVLGVPMLHDGVPVGAILVARDRLAPFSDTQIELLKTFAAQAVIAIENVRLFKELQARTAELTRSVDELTALGEVSRAVSSTLDLDTVLATIVSRAVDLSGSDQGIVYEFDEGSQIFHARAAHRITPAHLETVRAAQIRLGQGAIGRAGVIREPVQVADIQDEAQPVAPQVRELLAREGMRSLLAVPLVRDQRLLGGLVILRRERGAFAPEVVATLQTFAIQSVLAIQNARLFREIEDKSRQLEVASQHKSEFLANMSHELRTPLNAVIGFSEVLADRMFGDLNEKQEEYLKDIHDSGQHLLSLINDILDLSKVEAGRMELELTDFNFPAALDNALTLVRERAGRHGIALRMNVDERLEQVRADERKIRQVVLNLLSNAIKFTPEGGRIEVRAGPVDGSVEVSVSDTGVGIAPEDQEAIFEEFRQVGTAAKKVEGTGLGLALSRKFVELHGGRIWVRSQVGIGSTFTFTLPRRSVDEVAAAQVE